jgi:hypothetical protein
MSCTLQNRLKIRIMGSFHRNSVMIGGEHKKPIFRSFGTYQNRSFVVYEAAYVLYTTESSKNQDYGLNPLE